MAPPSPHLQDPAPKAAPDPPSPGTTPPSPSSPAAEHGLARKGNFRRRPTATGREGCGAAGAGEEELSRRPLSGGGAGAAMHEEVIRQRDIELEGKNERIRGLLAEADALRARLRKADAAAAAAAIRAREATAVAAAAVAVTAILLLLLLLAWAGWPWPVGEWSPSAGPVSRAAGPRVTGHPYHAAS